MGSINKTNFTLFYCEKHCCGIVFLGIHNNVPEWHQMCGDGNYCNWTWWRKNGLISYDKVTGVEIIEPPVDFNVSDCGGFEFSYYANSITSQFGDIELVDDSPLRKWFENYSC